MLLKLSFVGAGIHNEGTPDIGQTDKQYVVLIAFMVQCLEYCTK